VSELSLSFLPQFKLSGWIPKQIIEISIFLLILFTWEFDLKSNSFKSIKDNSIELGLKIKWNVSSGVANLFNTLRVAKPKNVYKCTWRAKKIKF
jgi:hypothetical protein